MKSNSECNKPVNRNNVEKFKAQPLDLFFFYFDFCLYIFLVIFSITLKSEPKLPKNVLLASMKDLFKLKESFKGGVSGLRWFLATENSLKWWKMLISSSKLFSFSRYLHFCLDFIGHVEKTAWLQRLG